MYWNACKRLIIVVSGLMLLSFKSDQKEETVVISVGEDALPIVQSLFQVGTEKHVFPNKVALVEVPKDKLDALSAVMHQKFHRCGGFIVEENWEKALSALSSVQDEKALQLEREGIYRVDQHRVIENIIEEVSEVSLRDTITTLSSYRNRYYKSSHGLDSQEWLLAKWKELTAGRSDVSVELISHSDYPQPSVVLTWQGTKMPDEVIVLGGHGDSIAGWFPGNDVLAPGADDNASGVATITEVIRLLVDKQFKPERTIKMMSYAAEEVGLLGSKDIADQYREDGVQVLGVMQLDMTNFAGSSYDMVLIEDHTNSAQNDFIRRLAKTYIPKLQLGSDQCGYACSDHASWTRNGFPASFPFESTMAEHNRQIHTKQDTLARSNHNAEHAVPFAKLAVAFLVELSSL